MTEFKSPDAWRNKRFGKILGSEVENQIHFFRQQLAVEKDFKHHISITEKPDFWDELAKSPNWAIYYQESLKALIARFIVMTGAKEVIFELAAQEFPADTANKRMEEYFGDKEAPDSPLLIPLFLALLGNIEAMTRFSCTMHDLFLRIKEKQCIESLAKAASIDTGMLSLPVAQFYMKFLQLSGDTENLLTFFRSIGIGPHKKRQPYQELRWAEYLLREEKAFEVCTQDEIHDLIVNGLKIYGGDDEHKDSKKALFGLFRKWRKEAGN